MCSLFLSFRYSAWVVFNAEGSFEIYMKNKLIKESQHLFVYTIIISEKSPVCTSERSCENARMYDFVVGTLASL